MQAQVNEDELQKAIDDITNSAQGDAAAENADAIVAEANNETVATPEGDLPDFGAPLAPVVPEPGTMPDGMVAGDQGITAAAPAEAQPVVGAPAAPEIAAPEVAMPNQPVVSESAVVPAEVAVATPEMAAPEVAPEMTGDMSQVKAGLLQDLAPLMSKITIEPERKFHIYRDMMTTNGDKSVIPAAYETARQIGDEQQRGEALLALLDAIDG